MAGIKRTKTQRARDHKRIADLYLRGWTQMDIAEELETSNATICRDLKTLHAAWLKSSLEDYDEAKGRELAKIDKLEFEYWLAWERSYQNKEVGTRKTVSTGELERREAIKREERQFGDPRFLTGIQWCINKRCEVLGLDAPKKIDATSDGAPLFNLEEWKKVAARNAKEMAAIPED